MLPGQISYPGQSAGIGQAITTNLPSGATFNVPPGSYYMKLGPQSVLQWKDINSGLWRGMDSGPTNNPIMVASDGSNFRVMNISGTIQGVNTTTAGTLYQQANTTVSFAAPVAGTPSRTATGTPIIGGSLTFTVTAGGTSYSNPMFFVDPPQLCGGTPGLCIPATIASCTVTGGVISAPVTGFGGAGYITVPNVTVIDATNTGGGKVPGTGCIITAAIANGTPASGGLTGIVMTDNGAGYDGTHIPAVTVTSATGINAAATALPSMALKSVTVAGTNTGYTASVVGLTNLGTVAGTPVPVYDEFVMPRSARFSAAQSGGVLGTPVIEDAGNGFQTVPLAKQAGNATADGSVNATFTAVIGGVNNFLIYWQVG